MDGSFWMIMAFAMIAAGAIRRDQVPVDEAKRAERSRKFRTLAVVIAGVGALVYAALGAIMSIALLYDLTLGRGPRSTLLFLMVPGMAAASVMLGWIGMLLLRDRDLPGRISRAWAAAVEAFCEPAPQELKPKPARHDLD